MASKDKYLFDDVKQNWFKIALESDVQDLISSMDNKELQLIPSEQGSRGLRYWNDKLEYSTDNGMTWTEIQTGSGSTVTVEDILTSTSSTNALSANMGRELKDELDTHTSDADIHVTLTDKSNWNAKADNTLATTTNDGLLSKEDKGKLDGLNNNIINDTLTSTSVTESLSANQGRVIDEKLTLHEGKVDVVNELGHVQIDDATIKLGADGKIYSVGGGNSTNVIDVLTSTSPTDALSANQGRELKSEISLLDEKTRPYNNRKNLVFGEEYLSHFHKKIMNGQPSVITFSGDSTTAGLSLESEEFKLDKLMGLMLKKHGLENISTVNRGFSGDTVSEWVDTHLAGDLATNPDLLVLRWGLNEYLEKDTLISKYREGLTTIRNAKGLVDLSILIMSPNSTNDSSKGRNIVDHEQLNEEFRQLASDFNCTFIDTFTLWKDSENAKDWMDEYYSYKTHLHPLGVMNLWIISKIFDVVIPSAIIAKYGSVGGGRDFIANPLNIETESIGLLPRNRMYQYTAHDIPVLDSDNLFNGSNVEEVLKELFTYADSGKRVIIDTIGSPILETDSFSEIANKYDILMSEVASAVVNKGGQMVYTDSLSDTPDRILNIPNLTLNPNFRVIHKINIEAPTTYEITLNNYLSESQLFTTILEFIKDDDSNVYYNLDFDNTDTNNFVDNPIVEFDGFMKLTDTYKDSVQLGDDYLYELEVDFEFINNIKSIKKVF